jgi:hypothetical protein
MKKNLLLVLLMIMPFAALYAQSPESFTYQCVVRDANGDIVPDQQVSFRLSIVAGSVSGTVVYSETHDVTTNMFALANLVVGTGTVISGDISAIDWGSGLHFFRVEVDITGSASYVDMGTVQLLSVPYALYAKTSGNSFSGNYNDLTNQPDFTGWDQDAGNDFTGSYNDLANKPVLAGDVNGQIENNTVTGIQGMDISPNIPANGQVLKWNNVSQTWEPSDDQLGAAGTTDGVVTGASVTGTVTKTLTLIRSNGLGDITAVFTDLVDDADADPLNEIQTLSLSGDQLTLSNGNTVTLPTGTTYTAGAGIDIQGNEIINIAPDQNIVMLSGTGVNVSGTYPNFTITNTQPGQTVTITGAGATNVSGVYPNFTISSTDNNTEYTAGSGINISGNQIINTEPDQEVNIGAGTGISVTGTYPDFTVVNTQPDQLVNLTGSGSTTVSGTYPNFTINSTDNNTTYTAGTGINIVGTEIINTAPNQPVTISGAGATSVSGSYPSFTISSTDNNTTYTAGTGMNLSGTVFNAQTNSALWNASQLQGTGISSGAPANGQVLKYNGTNWAPAADNTAAYTAGSGINIAGNTISNAAPDQTVVLTGAGATSVSGTYPNFTITSTDNNSVYTGGTGISVSGTTITNTLPDQTVTLTGTGAASVSGSYPNFTINSTDNNTTYNAGNGITLSGTTFDAQSGTAMWNADKLQGVVVTSASPTSGQVLKYNGTQWAPAADNNNSYVAGTGLTLSGNSFSHNAHTGDATGTAALTVTGIQGRQITSNAPANGQVLKWNTTNNRWELGDDQLGAAGTNDGVVTSIGVSGTTTKTITLTRSQSLPDLTATFTDDGSVYTAGSGISIASNVINNTAPDQTVTLTQGGATTITGTYPNFTISSANTTYTAGTGMTLTGTTFNAQTTNALWNANQLQGVGVITTTPSSGQVLKYNGTNWAPAADNNNTYTGSTGINVTGTTITNTMPDQTVTISGGGATTVSGAYPSFTISSTDQNTTYTAGTGMTLSGTTFNAQTTSALWNANQLQGYSVATTMPTSGYVMKYNGTSWAPAVDNNDVYTAGTGLALAGNQFSHSAHSGDVSGTSAITVTGLQGRSVTSTLPSSGQVLKFNGTSWAPANDDAGTGTVTSIATNNGITGGTITTTGTLGLTGQALALHNLATSGIIARTGAGTVAARTITGGSGITVTNGDGVSGNPTVTPTYGTTAGTISQGNHTHAIHTRGAGLTGSNYDGSTATTWAVNFGTTAGTVSEGNHAHSAYTAAGTTGMIQYNNAGAFGANSNLFWDVANGRLGVGLNNPNCRMVVKGNTAAPATEPLFEIKDKNGQTVFIVYQDSVRIYVDDDPAKTNKGAFAVSGRNTSKAFTNNYFMVTPDSSRVWTNDPIAGFGVKGISGNAKNSYMQLSPQNYFIGHDAGKSIGIGEYNVFLGYQAGYNTRGTNFDMPPPGTTASRNVFIGYQAGFTNGSGYYNTFIGFHAGYSNSSGSSTVCIGNYAGYSNNAGYNNNFVGNYSGYSNTVGNQNNFYGYYAGYTNGAGHRNNFFGGFAGRYNTSGSDNVFFGNGAGSANTTGNYNLYLGTSAGNNNSTGSSNICIGYQAGFSETGSNKLYIENSNATSTTALIYGEFNNDILRFNAKVGVGLNPIYKLHVSDIQATGYLTGLGHFVNLATSNDAAGVYGSCKSTDYYGYGGNFEGGYMGVRGNVAATGSGGYYGVYGASSGGSGTNYGVYGAATGGSGGTRYGVYGTASGGTTNYAGYFNGNVHVNGTLSKSGGTFRIDHPLDPENKYLNHAFVESPDMKNIYDGTVMLDNNGEASIELPDYFSELNTDFRYQLTPIGQPAGLYIKSKLNGNVFVIAGGTPGMEVSWQITGIRKDPWAKSNPVIVEEMKKVEERGKYLNPELYGKGAEKSLYNSEEKR